MIEEEIAKRFVELLKKRNLTTYKYTKNCSVSKNSAYNVSQGKNVRIDTLNQICEDLGINLHKFFEYQDKEDITLSEDEKILIDDYRTTTKSLPRAEFDLSSTLKVQARSSWSLQNGDIANRFNVTTDWILKGVLAPAFVEPRELYKAFGYEDVIEVYSRIKDSQMQQVALAQLRVLAEF